MISQELLLSFKCARCQKSRPSGLVVGFQLRPRACVRYCTIRKIPRWRTCVFTFHDKAMFRSCVCTAFGIL